MLENASEGFRMLLNVSESFRMLHIGSECFRHKPHTAHRTQHTTHSPQLSKRFTAHNLAMQDSIYARKQKHDLKFLPGSWIPQVSKGQQQTKEVADCRGTSSNRQRIWGPAADVDPAEKVNRNTNGIHP